ncbi:MAG: glycosyltransferase family 4 protein [Spirochaetes bacterium]|nr:glycosyltransferase family 4 protein [Spirochaetota bacterium]
MDILENLPIIHLNTADSWRGGEKQAFYLTSSLHQRGFVTYCICQKNSPLHEMLSENRLPHFPVRMRSELDIIAAGKISKLLKKTDAKILHMHTSHAHSLGYLANCFYKVPVNIVSRRVDFKPGKNFFSRLKYGFPDKYIAVSKAIRDILINYGMSEEKITAVYSGVDLIQYKNIKSDYLLNEFSMLPNIKKKVKLANVAALTHQKDHATLLRAVGIIIKKFNNFILFITGDGELKDSLIKLRDRLGLGDHVIFTGFRNDALNLIDFADIFIMSSRLEGLGTSIIDAMALKKAIIATDTGGIPELIRNEENGILVPRENSEELAGAIVKLIQDKSLRRKLSRCAFKDAQDYSIENTVNKTIDIYRDLYCVYLNKTG